MAGSVKFSGPPRLVAVDMVGRAAFERELLGEEFTKEAVLMKRGCPATGFPDFCNFI
jgi:hypothetical protein